MRHTTSIALITYNGEKYLARQLESLTTQTRLPDELVVCDDGSTDKTVEILEEFAKTSPFLVKIYQNEEKLGIGKNFRKAFFLCEKNIVFFCDQDDVWLPHKIASAMEIFENEPMVGMVLMNDLWTDATEKPILYADKLKYLNKWLVKENSFHSLLQACKYGWAAHNIACRRSFYDTLFPENAPACVDIFDQWVFRILGACCDVRILLEPSALFRRHGENYTSHSRKSKNPLTLLIRASKRHMDLKRINEKFETFQQAADFLTEKRVVLYPEVILTYHQGAEHFARRIKTIESLLCRLSIIPAEYFSGNYNRYSRGFKDAILDFIVLPRKLPK